MEIDEAILSKMVQVGLVDHVARYLMKHELEAQDDYQFMFRETLVMPTTHAFRLLSPLLLPKLDTLITSTTPSEIFNFDTNINPWIFVDIIRLSATCVDFQSNRNDLDLVSRYINRHSTSITTHLLLPDLAYSSGEVSGKQFLTKCIMVVEASKSMGKQASDKVQLLDRFVKQICSLIDNDHSTHWLSRFETDRITLMQTLRNRLPEPLVALVLSYVVGDE